jgi:hypothetical protein
VDSIGCLAFGKEDVMRNHSFMATVLVSAFVLLACGPAPEPDIEEPQGPTPDEIAQMQAEAEAPYRAAIQKFNDAIWELDADLLHEALTQETYDLFMERSRKEAELRDIEEKIDDEYFLKQQQDYKIVYTFKSVDLDNGHAVVQGVIEGEVQWESEINFVDVDGEIRIDHAAVLEKSIADLDAAIEAKKEKAARDAETRSKLDALIADHNTAIADKDAEMFESTISAETAELAIKYLSLLPKKEGGKKKASMEKFIKFKAGKVSKVEVKEIDFDEMTAVLVMHPVVPKKLKKGEEPPASTEKTVKLVEEGGRLVLDCTDGLKKKIADLEAAAGGEEEKGEKKAKKKKKDE